MAKPPEKYKFHTITLRIVSPIYGTDPQPDNEAAFLVTRFLDEIANGESVQSWSHHETEVLTAAEIEEKHGLTFEDNQSSFDFDEDEDDNDRQNRASLRL